MGIAATVRTETDAPLGAAWSRRKGRVVPATVDVALADGAVDLDAVCLYADLAHSTQLVRSLTPSVAAKIVRAYLSGTTKLIKHHGGEIRSFDGDRVMGVFLGDAKNSNAAKCALRINWFMLRVLRPKAEAAFPSLSKSGIVLTHCTGVHSGPVMVVRGGVRGSNDLVFVGSPPNIAAKLSDQRSGSYRSYITASVYESLNKQAKFSDGESRWQSVGIELAGETWKCFRSSWWWSP